MKERDLTEIISRYLRGELAPEEQVQLEKDLETDEELRQELTRFQKARALAAFEAGKAVAASSKLDAYKAAFRDMLKAEGDNYLEQAQVESPPKHQVEEPAKPLRIKNGWWITFALLLITAAAIWYFYTQPRLKPIALAYGEVKTGTINKPGEIHAFSFDGALGDTVFIFVQSEYLNPTLKLYDSTGKLISSSAQEANDTLTLTNATLPSSGKFVLHISGKPNNGAGNYQLRIEKSSSPIANTEPSLKSQPTSEPKKPEEIGKNSENREPEKPSTPLQSSRLLALATDHLADHFTEDFKSANTKSGETKDTLSLAGEAFDEQNWKQAIALYKQVKDIQGRSSAYAKMGMAYLQNNQPDSAIVVFKNLKEHSLISDWQEKGHWYLLLAYLTGGEKYRKNFEAELDMALKNPKMKGEMMERFKALAAEFNDLWLFPGMLFAKVTKEMEDFQDTVPDWTRDTVLARKLMEEYFSNTQSGQEKKLLAKLDTVGRIYLLTMGRNSEEYASVMHGKGFLYQSLSFLDSAILFYQEAIAIRKNVLKQESLNLAMSYNNIGLCFYFQSDYDQAIEAHSNSLAIRMKLLGEEHIEVANSYVNLGICFYQKSNYDKTRDLFEKSLAIRIKILGVENPDVAKSYNNLGSILRLQGDYDRAIEVHQKALAIKFKIYEETHPEIGVSYINLGNCYIIKGDIDKAIEFFKKSLTIDSVFYGAKSHYVATSYLGLGNCYYKQKKYNRAMIFYNKALEIRIDALDTIHTEVANVYINLGGCAFEKGEYNEAIAYFKKSLPIYHEILGSKCYEVASANFNIGNCYYFKKEYKEALAYFRTCLNITLRRSCGKFCPGLRYFFRRIARIRLQKMPPPEQNLLPTASKSNI